MRNHLLPIIASATMLFASLGAHAAIDAETEARATQLLENGKSGAAFEILRNQQKTTPQNWFLYGMAAHQAGKLKEAEKAYRSVLKLDPSSGRAKLELARVLSDNREWPESRQLLLDVKAENPPERVRQNIDRYLAVINEREGEYAKWRVRTSVGAMYDSNVNNATTSDTVVMFGLPFTLSDDAKAKSDWAYTMRLEADHVAMISGMLDWQSNISFSWTDYLKHDEFDVLQMSVSSGPVFKIDPKTKFSLPVTASAVAYTDRSGFYSASVGIAPQLRHQLNNKIALNLDGNLSYKAFVGNKDRNTVSYSVSSGFDLHACGQGTFRFGGTLGREDSGIDTYSNDNWALNASLFCPLASNMAVSVYGSYGQSEYDEREAAYTLARKDKKTTVGINFQYQHNSLDLTATFELSYTDNQSNLTLYDYEKVQGNFTLKKQF